MSSPSTSLSRAEKSTLYLLAAIGFTHIVDFMVLMPLGPMLQRDLHIGARQFGVLVSSYTFAAAVSGLLCALLLDQFDRKRSLVVLTLGFALATLGCAWAPNFQALLVARAWAGAFGGVLTTVTSTMVGDYIAPQRRGRAGAIMSGSFALSTVAGVPLSLFLATHAGDLHLAWLPAAQGWRVPFGVIALLALFFGWRAHLRLPPVPGAAAEGGEAHKNMHLQIWSRLRTTFSQRNHLRAIAFGCTVLFSSFCVIPYITIYATGTIHFPEKLLSLMYLIGGGATLLSARWIGKRTDRIGKRRSFYQFALLALIPVLLLTHAHFFFSTIVPWLYIVISTSFFVLVSGRWIPALALVTGAARPQVRGTFMSLSGSAQSVAMGLATMLSAQVVAADAQGALHGFHYAGYIAVAATVVAFWLLRGVEQVG